MKDIFAIWCLTGAWHTRMIEHGRTPLQYLMDEMVDAAVPVNWCIFLGHILGPHGRGGTVLGCANSHLLYANVGYTAIFAG